MLAQTKRRRVSLFSLPVVVAIGFLLVAKLAAWQRSDLIAELADCVAHGETREALDAVHKLATMPHPPIPVLVDAAASDEHETAEAGQVSISRLLRRWQRDIERKHREGSVASELSELAASLAEKQNDFASADHLWLASTARKILAVANRFPPQQTPLVAAHCDAILTAIGDVGSAASTVTAHSASAAKDKTEKALVRPAALAGNSELDNDGLERELSAFTPRLLENGSQAVEHEIENRTPATNPSPDPSPPPAKQSVLKFGDGAAGSKAGNSPATGQLNRSGELADDVMTERVSSRPGASWRSDWSQPIYRILPAAPADVLPIDASQSPPAALNSTSTWPSEHPALPLDVAADESLGGIDSRELLRYWLTQECSQAVLVEVTAIASGTFSPLAIVGPAAARLPIESELARRGFGRLTIRIVRQFFSEDAEERMRLVDYVLARPGAGAGAWLLLLADDSDAEVRLFAVTLMATSNDATLVEKAWQVAIRDRDPRIADLAGRLRERRGGTLRR